MRIFFLLTSSILFCAPFVTSQDYTCSATNACEIGCCSKDGFCGLGPDYCSTENCIGNCDRKSDCDPGWGTAWSASKNCPLNVCCSKYGFCGTTADFCGTSVVTNPSCGTSSTTARQRVVGYYESWAITRPCDAMYPEQIPLGVYTHINFAFAFVDPKTFAVSPMSASDVGLYKRITALKQVDPNLKVWISVGGWSMNDPDQPTATTFSDLAGSAANQKAFFESLGSFMITYGFDGVDIDWEYPVAEERSGKPADFANYVTLLRNMKNYFSSAGRDWGVTITIPTSYWYLQHFDIVNIAKIVDWINVMSYDLHGTWDSTNTYLGPYINAHTNLTEIDQALKLLWRNNIDPSKVVLGLGFYGRSFTLASPSCSTPGCVFTSGAPAGSCTGAEGTLSFAEIKRLVDAGAQVTTDTTAAVKMVVYDTNKWVSYDDATTLKMKVDYANQNCLGGVMVWAISTDDKNGTAATALSQALGGPRNSVLLNSAIPLTECRWTNCGDDCPAGMTPAEMTDGKSASGYGMCNLGQYRKFCCPTSDVPKCYWGGGPDNTFAQVFQVCHGGGCDNGYVAVGTSIQDCSVSHKVLCCEHTLTVEAFSECDWHGTAPFCGDNTCPAPPAADLLLVKSGAADGGERECWTGSKSLCCLDPPPYINCAWTNCQDTCAANKFVVAMDSCTFGTKSYCCELDPLIAASSDPYVVDFDSRVKQFLADPSCPTVGVYEDTTFDKRDLKKRVNSAILASLMSDIGLAVHADGTSGRYSLIKSIWDNDMADGYAKMSDFASAQTALPDIDPAEVNSMVVCNYDKISDFLALWSNSKTCLCEEGLSQRPLVSPTSKRENYAKVKRKSHDNSTLEERMIETRPWDGIVWKEIPGVGFAWAPTSARMLRGIATGDLPFRYFRMIHTPNQGLILEVVFAINNPRYQQVANDNALVLHFHIDSVYNNAGDGGSNFGVTAVNMFHAHNTVPPQGQYATGWIQGIDEPWTRRSVFLDCARQGMTNFQERWFPGRQINLGLQPTTSTLDIYNIGNQLYTMGALNPRFWMNPTAGRDFLSLSPQYLYRNPETGNPTVTLQEVFRSLNWQNNWQLGTNSFIDGAGQLWNGVL